MPIIKPLPEELVNKIAAGEVIERPASVVKELIENSLDAGATKISIEIKGAGSELIKITDNGYGMEEEDAKNCILRHSTSKISNLEDLYAIKSLGFRGEALSSIAAVSVLTIRTKQKGKIEGYEAIFKGGIHKYDGATAADDGTIIEVKDLFFNTPARKKFMKSDLVEMKHIIDIVTRYALINKIISFQLVNEGRSLLNAPGTPNMRANIANIYGSVLAKDLLKNEFEFQEEVGEEEEGACVKVEAYFSKPMICRNDKTQQSIFVNGRYVKNDDINQAIYDAYHSTLFHGKHPVYVINIEIDPEAIDVNVHPNKTTIKIEQKEIVYQAVLQAINEALKKNNLIPEVELKTESDEQLRFGVNSGVGGKSSVEEGNIGDREDSGEEMSDKDLVELGILKKGEIDNGEKSGSEGVKKESKYTFDISEQKVFSSKTDEETAKSDVKYEFRSREPKVKENDDKYLSGTVSANAVESSKDSDEKIESKLENSEDNRLPASLRLPEMRILGQIHKTFFVAETSGGLLIIDQHVVQERVLYEKFMQQYLNKNIAVQNLLEKELITFTGAEKLIVLENLDKLKLLGFELEHFGENDFQLSSIPIIFGRALSKELIHLIVNQLVEGGSKELEKLQEEIITRMACRASIKAGDNVTIPQIKKLLQELSTCKLPFTCPHGRSIFIKVTADELEKKFRRK